MPTEERLKKEQKKKAEEEKAKGNDFYKKKDFENALTHYQNAIELDPIELTYYTNKAAVYFEQKQFEKCVAECDIAIQKAKDGYYDYVKLAKAMGRKANALLQLGQHDEAIDLYKSALLENNDQNIRDQLKKAEKFKKDEDARLYLSVEKAEEHRQKGNELFAAGSFPDAVQEYTEGLRRDPNNKNIFSNRCAAYIKLMETNCALKDAEKCLEIDPKFVKAYARKGTIQHMMKEYHKALATFDKGLSLDPDNKDCREGKMKTTQAIQSGAYGGGQGDEERFRHAMADPEIQMLMRDPRIQQVLKDFQENPKAGQDALKDPFINEAVNKLIAAGVIKLG